MNNTGKIGIFDSGIGGVTVLKEILKVMPNEDYLYLSDSKNNPYGDKNSSEIISICESNVKYLMNNDCKIIVVACNTASAIAIESLRKEFSNIKFIGIEPAYKMVHDYDPEGETLIMATKGTIESEKFNVLYNRYNNHKTYVMPCTGLADIIEEGDNEKIKQYLNKSLEEYKGKVKNVVLGCTHYPLIKKEISDVLEDVNFYEGSSMVAKYLKQVLNGENLLNNIGSSKIEFIDTSKSKEKEKRFYEILNMSKNEF